MSLTERPRNIAQNIGLQLDEIKRLIESGFNEEDIISTLWKDKLSPDQEDELKWIISNIIEAKGNKTIALTKLLFAKKEQILDILDR
jgi:hypothetical protein